MRIPDGSQLHKWNGHGMVRDAEKQAREHAPGVFLDFCGERV